MVAAVNDVGTGATANITIPPPPPSKIIYHMLVIQVTDLFDAVLIQVSVNEITRNGTICDPILENPECRANFENGVIGTWQ